MAVWMPSYSGRASYRPRISNSPRKPKAVVAPFTYAADIVWGAAAAATRINAGYIKEPQYRYDEATNSQILIKEANKVIVRRMLETGAGWTEEDLAAGVAARDYWKGGLLKLMTGKANDFEANAIAVANKDTIDSAFDLAVASSLVTSAQRGMARDAANETKMQTNSKHVGKVKDAINLVNAEVLTVRYNSEFGKYRIDAKCEGNLYSWWSSNEYKPTDWVSVKGKVKGHYVDRDTNVAITQLNYVKEV